MMRMIGGTLGNELFTCQTDNCLDASLGKIYHFIA